jgi:hypothetical protein
MSPVWPHSSGLPLQRLDTFLSSGFVILNGYSSAHRMWQTQNFSIIGPTSCAIYFQFITINSIYMFRAPICSSSGGTVYTKTVTLFVLKLVYLFKITYVHCHWKYIFIKNIKPVPLAARSKTWVCGRSPAAIVGSNPDRSRRIFHNGKIHTRSLSVFRLIPEQFQTNIHDTSKNRAKKIPPRALMFVFCVCVVCCEVEVSATNWSLVQRSPTDCDALLCVITKPPERGGHSPRWAAESEKIYIYVYKIFRFRWNFTDNLHKLF